MLLFASEFQLVVCDYYVSDYVNKHQQTLCKAIEISTFFYGKDLVQPHKHTY